MVFYVGIKLSLTREARSVWRKVTKKYIYVNLTVK